MKIRSLALAAPLLILCLCPTSVRSADDSWKLPKGYYVPAKFPMYVVHPRNSEKPDWAYSKNAHPGVRWETPVIIQGGASPFKYEIVDDGGARGLAIGGELKRVEKDGFIVHEKYDEYGVLYWDSPVDGRAFFDSDMKLIVKERKDNLGIRGAEIAVPVK